MTQSGVYKTYTLPTVGGSSDHCPRILVEHPIQGNIWIYGDSPYVDHNTPGCLKTVGSLYGHGGDVTYQFEDGGGGDFDAYMEIKWGETSATFYISTLYHIYPTSYYYGIYEITDIPGYPLFKEATVNYANCTDELLEEIESTWSLISTGKSISTVGKIITHIGYLYKGLYQTGTSPPRSYIYRSADGINWTRLLDTTAIGSIWAINSVDGVLFVHTSTGLYRSTDGGTTLVHVINITGPSYVVFKMGSTYYCMYYDSGNQKIASSSDGITWTLDAGTVAVGYSGGFDSAVFNEYAFVTVSEGEGHSGYQILIKRSSDGINWDTALSFATWTSDVFISSRNPTFTEVNGYLYLAMGWWGLYRTSDGITWENVYNPVASIISVGAYNNERVFAGTGTRASNTTLYIYESPTGASGTWTLSDYTCTNSTISTIIEYNNTTYSFEYGLLTSHTAHRLTPAPSIPACKYYIYENEDDPNYPGYTVMTINGSAWVPSDYEGIGIFSRTAWTTHTGYKYYNYFHHIDTLSIDYDGIQTVWISGSYSSNTTFIANDAIILYCEETDTRLDIPGGTGYVAPATEITSILQTGNNTVRVYLYNGPTFKSSGQAEYYENGGVLQCDNMYIRYV